MQPFWLMIFISKYLYKIYYIIINKEEILVLIQFQFYLWRLYTMITITICNVNCKIIYCTKYFINNYDSTKI